MPPPLGIQLRRRNCRLPGREVPQSSRDAPSSEAVTATSARSLCRLTTPGHMHPLVVRTIWSMAAGNDEPSLGREGISATPPATAPAPVNQIEPALAWRQFTEIAGDPLDPYEHSRDEYLALLDSFLTNPERHREHVKLISGAAAASQQGVVIRRLYGPAWRPMKLLLAKFAGRQKRELAAKLHDLGTELTASVQPAEIDIDVLPLRGLPTHDDWLEDGLRLMLMQVKLAVRPEPGLEPTSLSLLVTGPSPDVRFVDRFPSTEFEELGTREVQLTEEGKFVSTATASSKVGSELGTPGAKVTAQLAESTSEQVTTGRTEADKFTYTPRVRKVISSAVNEKADWQLLGSPPDNPVGGLDFFASLLTSGEARDVSMSIDVGARFEGWGDLRVSRTVMVRWTDVAPGE
jgi:hypothetical protein